MKALPKQIEEQIISHIGLQNTEMKQLSERVQMGALNSRQAFEQVHKHEESSAINAHNIKQLILDVINENLIKNAGLELDEEAEGIPDDWVITNELRTSIQVFFDNSRAKYGNRSLKFQGTNLTDTPRRAFITQTIDDTYATGKNYTLSFYYQDDGWDTFSYWVQVEFLNQTGAVIENMLLPVRSYANTSEELGSFARFNKYFPIPEGTNQVRISVGIQINPQTVSPVEAWIDYLMFHKGTVSYKPGELIAGIIETDHLKTNSITAKKIQSEVIEARHLVTENLITHKAQIGDLVVTDAKIENLNAGKLDAGVINTNLVSIESANGAIKLSNETLRIFDEEREIVTLGRLNTIDYGLKILAGEIELGSDVLGNPLFKVDNAGKITSRSGLIANFEITDNMLRTLDNSLELSALSSSISLSNHPSYKTTIRPSGIFGTAPIAQIKMFSSLLGEQDYYIEIDKVYLDDQVFIKDIDYSYNKKTGEIIKRKLSAMPDIVNVDFFILDSRGKSVETFDTAMVGVVGEQQDILVFQDGLADEVEVVLRTEKVAFQVKERASAIITDDALLDASYITNLIIGSAEIGLASIDTAHIRELHAKRIIAGTIEAIHISATAIQTKFADIDVAFINSAHIQEIDVSKLRIGGAKAKNTYKIPIGSTLFNFNNSLMSNNGIVAIVV